MPYSAYSPDRTMNGAGFYVTVSGWPDNAPPGYDAYCHYLTCWELVDSLGQASAVAVRYSYLRGLEPAYEGIDGREWCPYPPLYLEVLPEGQAPGAYTFRFTITCVPAGQQTLEGGAQTLEVPVFIAQAPLGVHSDCTHPVPGRKAWQDHMVELADKWQLELLNPDNTWGADNYYYDICSTYLEIGKYLQDCERYWDVAYSSICRYRDYLLECQPPGAAAPWSVFPRGVRQMYQSTRDPQWLDLLKSMTSGGWVPSAGDTDPMMMRETAYATAVWLELEWVDAGNRELLARGITYLLGQFNLLCAQQFGKGRGMVCEPFFFGLAMQTLTDYYDFVADPRIPQSLMGTCAWLWENAVDARSGYVKYDVWTPTTEWFTGLNPLMYNGWGFLYNVTGDDLWRRQGDILFEHQFDDGGYGWSPKQFAQMYRRSTDYVTRWRA